MQGGGQSGVKDEAMEEQKPGPEAHQTPATAAKEASTASPAAGTPSTAVKPGAPEKVTPVSDGQKNADSPSNSAKGIYAQFLGANRAPIWNYIATIVPPPKDILHLRRW